MAGGTTRNTASFLLIDLESDDVLVVYVDPPDVPTIVYWNEPR